MSGAIDKGAITFGLPDIFNGTACKWAVIPSSSSHENEDYPGACKHTLTDIRRAMTNISFCKNMFQEGRSVDCVVFSRKAVSAVKTVVLQINRLSVCLD